VSRPTIYKIIRSGRQRDFSIHKSTHKQFCCLKYGIKRLSKIEKEIEARRYNKDYPGQMLHGNTKRLPPLRGESAFGRRESLFVAIDDFSRELYAAVLPDKTQNSAKIFLEQVLEKCPYTIEQLYSNNEKEYRGDPEHHAFMTFCREHRIEQRFTKVKTPRTNGKAERVIKTIMELWHQKTHFSSSAHRKNELRRIINFYNGVRPHKAIGGLTPKEALIQYFYSEKL
jgi:transposase InsO family protein